MISRKYWSWMAFALAAMVGTTLANLAGPWLIRSLLGSIEGSLLVDQTLAARRVITTSAALLLVYALRPALRALQTWSTHVAGWGSVAEARARLYEHLQRLSPSITPPPRQVKSCLGGKRHSPFQP